MSDRRGQEIEPGAQANHGERMNLGNARLANAERGSDFLHGEFFVVVKGENALFFFRQFGNGLLEQVFHLRAEALEERCFLGLGWEVVGEILFLAVAGRLDVQAAEFETVEFGEQGLQFVETVEDGAADAELGVRTACTCLERSNLLRASMSPTTPAWTRSSKGTGW